MWHFLFFLLAIVPFYGCLIWTFDSAVRDYKQLLDAACNKFAIEPF